MEQIFLKISNIRYFVLLWIIATHVNTSHAGFFLFVKLEFFIPLVRVDLCMYVRSCHTFSFMSFWFSPILAC